MQGAVDVPSIPPDTAIVDAACSMQSLLIIAALCLEALKPVPAHVCYVQCYVSCARVLELICIPELLMRSFKADHFLLQETKPRIAMFLGMVTFLSRTQLS